MMNLGGCGAATACDCCIDLDEAFGTHLYPFGREHMTQADYIAFSNRMKPYLHPRANGIDTLELFMEGFNAYLRDAGATEIALSPLPGSLPYAAAREALIRQIDLGLPVPYLNLLHHNPVFEDYEWHWFVLNGYDQQGETLRAKAATYGRGEWLDFRELWESGHEKKGGMVLLALQERAAQRPERVLSPQRLEAVRV
ncbi:MAG: hypothetical protein PHY12_09550 [Eubacteriales bacterium]|nr:hypothetical protein [Eubacteriales bacterium]